MNVKIVFFLTLIPEGSRNGPKTCVRRFGSVEGGPWESGSGPRGAFLEGPGSAKVRQGSTFEGKTGRILTISFFASNDFLKGPRGSRKRVGRPKRRPRGAQKSRSSPIGGQMGGPGAQMGGPGSSGGGGAMPGARPGTPGGPKPEIGGVLFTPF